MKVAFVANAASTHTQRWARSMALRGHDITVFSVRRMPIEGVAVIATLSGGGRSPSTPALAVGYLKLRAQLRPHLESLGPDVIHAHYASTNGYLAALVDAEPTLLTVWGTDVVPKPGRDLSMPHRHRVVRAVEHADIVTSASDFMARHVRNVVEPEHMEIVPFGVDLSRFTPVAKPRSRTVLVAKSLEPRYGVDVVIAAVEKVSEHMQDTRLLIAGDGSLRKSLQQTAAASGADVTFLGPVPHDDLAPLMASADVVVNPTIVDESFGVVVLEAQAVGRPVVATRVGAIPTVCVEGDTALLVQPGDVGAMAEAILNVLGGSALANAERSGPEFVQGRYDWEDSVTMMERLYGDLAS